jgi:transposase InsO family protein
MADRGAPKRIRCDNGPEFTGRHFLGWCETNKITILHIQPGRPMQNGHIESFNGRFRDECLNAGWFLNLKDARKKTGGRITTASARTAASVTERRRNTRKHALRKFAPSTPVGWSPSHRTARRS